VGSNGASSGVLTVELTLSLGDVDFAAGERHGFEGALEDKRRLQIGLFRSGWRGLSRFGVCGLVRLHCQDSVYRVSRRFLTQAVGISTDGTCYGGHRESPFRFRIIMNLVEK